MTDFPHLKDWDLAQLDERRAILIKDGKVEDLSDEQLKELVAIAAQIRLRSGRVPKEEKAAAAPKEKKASVKKAASLDELDL